MNDIRVCTYSDGSKEAAVLPKMPMRFEKALPRGARDEVACGFIKAAFHGAPAGSGV